MNCEVYGTVCAVELSEYKDAARHSNMGKKYGKKRSRVNILNSRIRGKETPGGIATKFCMSVDIHESMT